MILYETTYEKIRFNKKKKYYLMQLSIFRPRKPFKL